MITGGFGMEMDLESGTMRQWVMGRDGVKQWAMPPSRIDVIGQNGPSAEHYECFPCVHCIEYEKIGGLTCDNGYPEFPDGCHEFKEKQ